MNRHILIEAVTPSVDGGRYPVKRVVGDTCVVEADIIRDGHAALKAVVKWKRKHDREFREAPMELLVNDRWQGSFPLEQNTRYTFTVEAWTDVYTSWLVDLEKRAKARMELTSEALEGIHMLEGWAKGASAADRRTLTDAAARLREAMHDGLSALEVAEEPALRAAVERAMPRADREQYEPHLDVVVDRPLALFGAWYEMFPRSATDDPEVHGTFRSAALRLPEIRDMGFDVVYLPPIHPIGTTHRKGRNNTLRAAPEDPGSPWAIGSADGGHMAVDPRLGTLADFDHFVETAQKLGLEVALDFAIQASPDHPWVKAHPEWFHHRPDGTIKYAENPPKKYQDIYPINFDTHDEKGLWNEMRNTLLFWREHGVKTFRVDNPHTKPLPFWEWCIDSLKEKHPELIFLAEAFTRPKMMKALAKLGFTQSYTYFTWRNYKWDLTEYLTELTQTETAEYYRPNFFANTPDILSEILVRGGRPAFKMRATLAATLSPLYGIYSGFELCENEPLAPDSEEYLHSEKYEIKARDWNAPGNIREYIALLNAIRRDNPALHTLRNLTFLPTDNDQLLAYAKATEDKANVLLVVVNLDPHDPHHGTVQVPPQVLGTGADGGYEVRDLISGARYGWSEWNYVRLDPAEEPAHILRVEKRG